MVYYTAEWCKRECKTKWCQRMAREKTEWTGVYLGVAGCYRPDDCTICLGKESAITTWMHHEEDEAIRFLTDVICHEEDHRAIHEVTKTPRTALCFDSLFGYPFDNKKNKEYLRLGEMSIFGERLTAYGNMIVEKTKVTTQEVPETKICKKNTRKRARVDSEGGDRFDQVLSKLAKLSRSNEKNR